ncbi:hypothetical protein [Agrococcus casei]
MNVMYPNRHEPRPARLRPGSVAANVAAELARKGKTKADLVPVLGHARNTVYSRFTDTPFDTDELEAIATFLDVPVTTFWHKEAA